MKVYLLFEKVCPKGMWCLCDYSIAVWNDLNKLHAVISDKLDVDNLDIRKTASNSWVVNNKFKIIETKIH